jgi:hypothetical protein
VHEVAEYAERRPARLGRRADDRDSAAGAQDRLDPVVADQRDRAPTFVEVQELARAKPLLGAQVAASRW